MPPGTRLPAIAQVGLYARDPLGLRRNFGRWSPWARFVEARAALDAFVYEEIALRRAERGHGGKAGDDVLSLLMAAHHEDGSPMSDTELRDELVTILERAELSAAAPKPERVAVRNITLAPAKGTRVSLDRPLR